MLYSLQGQKRNLHQDFPAFFNISDLNITSYIVQIHFIFVFFPIFFATHNEFSFITILSWLWFGIFVSGIINLMHETAHRLTFKEKKYCDILGEFFLGPLLIADLVVLGIDIGFIIINLVHRMTPSIFI